MAAYISVDRRDYDGALQVSIGDDGHGYRIAGPKYDGRGKTIIRHVLSDRDKREIMDYIGTKRTFAYDKEKRTLVQTNRTVTIKLPDGYKDADEFAKDCGFELA